ncbi:hypothetical protein NDU88_003917 [Pleurodeles waltl]|uniref:Uncharacterized protein n=1 Tax=Pleurodeles waltl TaxID=8319 RepID=A0AAV7NI18_PLEWA|nr:hypothetical protein NDU88_003917 [Pleurodeles waltl]
MPVAWLRLTHPPHVARVKDVVEWASTEEVRMCHVRTDERLEDDLGAWSAMRLESQELRDPPDFEKENA